MKPVDPPKIPGFSVIAPIGTGGFADVYLYEQALPRRRVAVKVLREAADKIGLDQFYAEANVMAQLSGHPSIVPIHEASVSSDGRPFLVMEYCPPPHIAQRYRKERIPVEDVLDMGVRISSAVETAHRVGILHRDIKPHNILTSTFGAPLLTDFGIAAVASNMDDAVHGFSVPWSPPETFLEKPPLDVRVDVYALAATFYSLLAGRPPHEVPGGQNDNATMIDRIQSKDPVRILRPDVPEALNDLLLRGLARDMDRRYPTAMALARAFQEVQVELGLPATRLEVIDASPGAAARDIVEDDRTLVRGIQVIVPEEVAGQHTLLRGRQQQVPQRPLEPTAERRASHATETPARRPVTIGEPEVREAGTDADQPAGWGRLLLGVGLAVVVLGAVVAALLFGSGEKDGDPDPPPSTQPSAVIEGGPEAPTDLVVQRAGANAVVTWSNPAAESDDTYQVRAGATYAGMAEVYRGAERRVEVPAAAGAQLCVEIRTVRHGSPSAPLTSCMVVG